MVWFYAAIILSISLSQYTIPKAYYYANEIIKLTVLCMVVSIVVNSFQRVLFYEKMLFTAIMFLSVWGIEQHYLGNVRLEDIGGYDSNGAAALFVFFSPLAMNRFFNSQNTKEKILGFICTLALLLAIIFTQSRGGLLGIIIALLVFVIRTKHPVKTIISGIVIGIILFTFMSEDYKDRMGTISTDTEQMGGSAESRLVLWSSGMMIFADNFMFGSGYMTFPYEKMKYESRFSYLDVDFREWIFRKNSPKVTHNTFIKILSECGLFAFIPYALLIIGTLNANRKIRKVYIKGNENRNFIDLLSAIDAGIIGISVCNMFINFESCVFLYVQIIVSAIIRGLLSQKIAEI